MVLLEQCLVFFQFKEEKKADTEEIKRLNDEVNRLRNALKEAKNRSKQVNQVTVKLIVLLHVFL